jgi:hypothetical protein
VMQELFIRRELTRPVFDLQFVIPVFNELCDHLDEELLARASQALGFSGGAGESEAQSGELAALAQALQTLWPEGPAWYGRFLELQALLQRDPELMAYLRKAGQLLLGIGSIA